MAPHMSASGPTRATLATAVLLLAACDEPLATLPPAAPTVDSATVSTLSSNVLAAVVTATVQHADSAAVFYREAATPTVAHLTPAQAVGDGPALLPVLGLHAARDYEMQVIAWGRSGTTVGSRLAVTTGELPADLPRYSAGGPDPSPGFVVFATRRYGIAIDNTGRVVWYHPFEHGPGLSFTAQPNGRYFARPSTPDSTDVEPWVEIDPLGRVTRTLTCARGLVTRFHDLIARPDGSSWLLCDETRIMDLRAHGGVADARVTGTGVQHLRADGTVLFEWSPFDHFEITDLDPSQLTGATVNWTHGNALDLDEEGDLLVSFRSLDEITKIDVPTGSVLWRLGGRRNEFQFHNLTSSPPPFARQHSVRVWGRGLILLLDNTGDPSASRAERYRLVQSGRHAIQWASIPSSPPVVTEIGGSVQDLSEGHRMLVSYGTAGRVEEYDNQGQLVWSVLGNPGYVFRAQRVASLYAPGVGTSR